jgi:transposase
MPPSRRWWTTTHRHGRITKTGITLVRRVLIEASWPYQAKDRPAGKVVVAVARELTGFIWAALQPPTAA